jgi:methionyl-tRNA formyltransferase
MIGKYESMRIIYMGSPAEVIGPLQHLLDHQAEEGLTILGVVSQPAKPAGRKQLLTDPPLADFAKSKQLTCWQPEKASHVDFLHTLRELAPDVIITAAYGQILSEAFLAIPRRATINIHPSLLPAYRGATPVPAALLDGCQETGVTILFTVKALDAGAIIEQERFPIAQTDDSGSLTERLFLASGPLLIKALARLRDPAFQGIEQDPTQVTLCRKIAKTDGAIDWTKPAEQILNEYRAYKPWPGSHTQLGEQRIVIEGMRQAPEGTALAKPGVFTLDKPLKALRVGTGSKALLVTQLKPAGSKSLDALSFWNGARLNEKGTFT